MSIPSEFHACRALHPLHQATTITKYFVAVYDDNAVIFSIWKQCFTGSQHSSSHLTFAQSMPKLCNRDVVQNGKLPDKLFPCTYNVPAKVDMRQGMC